LGTEELAREVAALRCGLDAGAWAGPQCTELTGKSETEADQSLPFDVARAHRLYQALFGQVEDLIKGKHLLIVPSGPLTQLPFQVLVTAPPAKADYGSAAWLTREHAITVLPAVSSLRALRRVAHASSATKPMIGFGNPLLDGPDGRYAKRAESARNYQRCHNIGPSQQVASSRGMRGVAPIATRSGIADIENIRLQAPLPETADELCAVADDLRADPAEIRLGANATEREVKALSASGRLADYRVVHFATHGAMAGELDASAEPGLILTPPDTASAEDDGYLSASEIAGLKLDADWVILSACNTAAGDASGAQALSGLARAFFYAQTRALLVSHWAVDSDATVKLITRAMREMSRDRSVGRAEALRRAMLALIDGSNPDEAHPAYWAPFVVVGEGAR
jgi:CHAT domain-containing protein